MTPSEPHDGEGQGAGGLVEQVILGYADFLGSRALEIAAGEQNVSEVIERILEVGGKLALRRELAEPQRRRVQTMTFNAIHKLDPAFRSLRSGNA